MGRDVRHSLSTGHRAQEIGAVVWPAGATVVRRLSLAPPTGISSCPADFGIVVLIGFSYPGRADVGLWYRASGCETLDNGRIGSFEGGNPSFYNAFLDTIDLPAPVG